MSDQALSHCTFRRTSPLYIPMTNTASSTTMASNARIITALRNADERAQTPAVPMPAAQHTVCAHRCKEDSANANASMSGKSGDLNGSPQHLLAVYSRESESPTFFADVDLNAARSCPVGIACSRKDRFSSASIDAASGWCFRWFLVARGCADHRNKLSHSWLP